ncbi:UNVERIFIED_CONTAM: tc1a [Trichonephila clavipes]
MGKLPDLDNFDCGQILGAPRMDHSISEIFTTQLNDGASRTVSKRTVQRSLDSIGFGSRRPTRVPLLNARHRVSRLARAREHRGCNEDDWKRVAWSDESPFRPEAENMASGS